MRKFIVALAATSLAVPGLATAAEAHDYYKGKVWRDANGRLRCNKSNGTIGLVVGAAGGALVGHAIDSRGERATGTILGAAAGAILGRQIERNAVRCR